MNIITLSSDHLNLILEFEKAQTQCELYYGFDKKSLQDLFNNPSKGQALGIMENEVLIAYGAFKIDWQEQSDSEGVYEISSVVVSSNHRGKGLGARILDELVSRAKAQPDYHKLYLTVSPLNIGALILYLKHGFIITDFKTNVYGPGTDRVYLTLNEK